MRKPVVSVLMSTYNETQKELDESICSILQQDFSDFEFVIINDNPDNKKLDEHLNSYVDSRIRIVRNEKNLGLVKSLNKGLELCNGEYIARMDADDISRSSRLQDELSYLCCNHLDMVGSFVEVIDETNEIIKAVMRFPERNSEIKKFMRWGSCICHPTWFLKKEVYLKLSGYRMVPYCEDYDFILRAIAHGYKMGNIPKVELSYRVRQSGISKSNEAEQFLVRDYLAKNMREINWITEKMISEYINSQTFYNQLLRLKKYKIQKQKIKNGSNLKRVNEILSIPFNHFFWRDIIEKITLLIREQYNN